MIEKLCDVEANVFGNLAQQRRRDVAAGMKGNRGRASGTMAKLLVRITLPYFDETELAQDYDDLARLQDRDIAHVSRDGNVLHPDKLGFENWIAILQQHGNDFS